jgi:FixJ family two-component response regulator
MDEKNIQKSTGALIYDAERNFLLLEEHELSEGEKLEIKVFGAWIPGQVALDAAGWYLLTLDKVAIRLHAGLPARSSEFLFSDPIMPQDIPKEQSPCVLLIDDDSELLKALSGTISLRLPHIIVEVANSSQAALELVMRKNYDTIVSDIKMPGIDGLTLLSKIHEIQAETPTILITGHGEHAIAIQALRGGAYDYIQKPIERDNFVASLLRSIQTCVLRRQVKEQQEALSLYARSLERLVQQRTNELSEAHMTKDKVISLVSQDLKEPIANLKNITQVLRQKLGNTELSEIVTRSFVDIEISIARTEVLLQDLLSTSDIEMQRFILHRKRCDLVQLCKHVLEKAIQDTAVELDYQGFPGLVEVEIDEEQIRQVLDKLIATLSTEKGSPITIMLQQVGKEAIITMRDQGENALGTEFYIARKIVERHQGHLEIQRFPENRRSFFVTLPLTCDYTSEQEVDASPVPRIRAIWTIIYHEDGVSQMIFQK